MDSWWSFGEGIGYKGSELELYRIKCPFCRERGNFTYAHQITKQRGTERKVLHFDTLKCGNCGNFTLVFWSAGTGLYDYRTLPWPLGEYEPEKHWPEDVGRYWSQAKSSYRAKNYDAALVMAGSCLQTLLRQSGAKEASLYQEIESLAAQGILPPVIKEWAHELRLIRNDSAHPIPGAKGAEQQDVADLLEFLDRLITYLIDLPHSIKEYRERKGIPKPA